MIPVLVIVALHGGQLLEKLGYIPGETPATLNWFTQKHSRRKWGAVVSNAMVVLAAVLTQPGVLEEIRCRLKESYPDI